MLLSGWENLSRCPKKLIHVCKKEHLNCIAGRAYILSKKIKTNISNFGHGFRNSCSILFPEAPVSCNKKKLKDFCSIIILFVGDQKVCLRFLSL